MDYEVTSIFWTSSPSVIPSPSTASIDSLGSTPKNYSNMTAILPSKFGTLSPINESLAQDLDMMSLVFDLNTVAYFYIMPILLSTGVATNLVNIYALHDLSLNKDKKQRGSATTYMYLNWLSVSQLLACLSIIPSLLNLDRENLSFDWAFYYAHFEIFSMNSLTSTCVYIVVGLSVDRFVAVCRPHSYRVLNRVRLALVRILASFMLPPIIYTPLCFFQKVEENKNDTGYIPVDNKHMTEQYFWIIWNILVELCHRLIPAIFIVVLNLCIILKFKKMRNATSKSCSTAKEQNSEKPERAKNLLNAKASTSKTTQDHDTKMFALLMGVIVVFLITILPAAYLGFTDTFGHKYYSFYFEVFRAIANLLEVLGFSLNFFLYFFLVPEVRKKLGTLLSSCCHRFSKCPKT